tara:strand:+ start:182 stop:1387 length:1206 start_codon:yes stop_codon:yes gene_type:complete
MTESKRPKIKVKAVEKEKVAIEKSLVKEKTREKKTETKYTPRTYEEKREKISIQEELPIEENTKTTAYDPNIAKKNLRTLYIITFLIGSIIIWVVPGKITILLASIVMIIYLVIGLRYAKSTSSKAVLADSMYYLGFLYTFVALVKILIGIEPTADQEKLEIGNIVGQMGAAISTTILGMAVRIYMTQFDSITSEPETETLNTLGELSSKMIESINTLDKVSASTSKTLKDYQEKSSKEMEMFAKKLSQLDLSIPAGQMMKLSETISELNKLTKSLEGYAERSKVKMDNAEAKLDGFETSIEKVNDQINKVKDVSADITKLNSLVETAQEDTKTVVDNTQKELKKLSDNVNVKIGNAARQINTSATNISVGIQKVEDQVDKLGSRLKKSVSDVIDFLKGNK